jgi:hypothetical protein
LHLLEDITSGDSRRIWSSACAIRTLRDKDVLDVLVRHLDEIKEKTQSTKLGGSLRPNSSHLNFALRKLEFVRDERGCLCSLYSEDDLFDPEQEEANGNIHIVNKTFENYAGIYHCQCKLCATNYHVEEQMYHYAWWVWKKVDEHSSLA